MAQPSVTCTGRCAAAREACSPREGGQPAGRLPFAAAALAGLVLAAIAMGTAVPARAEPPHGELARFSTVAGPGEAPQPVRGWLSQPDQGEGRGRLAAIVLMHGCGGPKAPSYRWAGQLVAWGFATLVLDSFGTRGITQVCSAPQRLTSAQRTGDAYGALRFLQSQRGIDPDRIGLMGWSHGGSAALWAVEANWSRAHQPYPWLRFRATTVFYPGCAFHSAEFTTPVLMLMGAADDWTPANPCRRLARTAHASDGKVQLVIYPGATHAFDAVRMTVLAYGHVLRYSPAATLDAQARVRQFLESYLKR